MWVEETKNGKYKMVERYEDYLTGQTKRVSVTMEKNTAQSRKTAQRALEEKIEQRIVKKEGSKMTLKELVSAYRTDQEHTVKKSTYTRNCHVCNTLMKILGENTLVDRLTARYVRDKFLTTGDSNGTLNERMIRFKALIRWGYCNDFITDISFLDKIEPFKDTTHREKIQDKYLESDEVTQLLDSMKTDMWRLLTEFLVLSGLRIGEALALTKKDIDFKASQIHVTKTYDTENKIVTPPKTMCSTRDVYMQEGLVSVCRQIKSLMLRQRLMNGYEDNELFFRWTDGGYLHYDAYRKYLRESAAKALGRKITPHTLRHTHASLLLENGISVDTISRRLGHENSKVTREIYLHVTKKLKERDDQQISKIKIM